MQTERVVIANPIINSPFEAPRLHFRFSEEGITDEIVLGRELILTSSSRVFVERSAPTGRGDTRTSAWAIPAG